MGLLEKQVKKFPAFLWNPSVFATDRNLISGSHGGDYEDDCLLGCCTV
jgi:hypothetical protein